MLMLCTIQSIHLMSMSVYSFDVYVHFKLGQAQDELPQSNMPFRNCLGHIQQYKSRQIQILILQLT